MSRSAATFGLLVANKHTAIPLRDVTVTAEVQGYVLGLKSTLKYTNDSSDPVEVLFRFPLEDSHAVVGLTAVLDGRKIKADIREKEEARAAYDDAIASGQSAALGEEKTGDIFSISLGNLPPQKDAEVHLELVGELPIDAEGNVRFSLPSTLKPRYTLSGSSDPLASVSDAPESQVEHASIPGVCGFEMSVLNATQQIADITSPTHTLKSVKDNDADKVVISLAEEKSLDKDLVILIEHKNLHQPSVLVEEGKEGEGIMSNPAVMVNFFPDFKHVETACEFIFLVDRSGSMSGSYIKSARETLMLFMKSLPEGCRFNILGFGSRYEWLFSEVSVLYSQETLDKAMAHLQDLQANLGGTELLPPLQDIFSKKANCHFSRQVFVLTDGSVSNTQRCIEKVKENAHTARCFTFGIGSGASTALVEGLAKAGNGASEFVKEGERMQPKVIRSLKRALQPSVTDVSVDFQVNGQYDVLQSPLILPPIYNGEKLVLYAILKPRDSVDKVPLEGTAILKGKIPGKEICHSLPFTINHAAKDLSPPSTVHHLAAKALIKEWQNERKSKEEIVKLSIEGSVISTHTAFIAIDEESSDCINAPMKTWDVQATQPSPSVQQLQQQVQACSMAMACNIDQVLSRGDKLDDLESKALNLSSDAMAFSRTATKAKGGFSFGSLFSGLFGRNKSSAPVDRHNKEATVVMDCDESFECEEDEDDEVEYVRSSSLRADENIATLIEEENESLAQPPPSPGTPSLILPSIIKAQQEEKESLAQPPPSPGTPSLILPSIIKAQQANGSWKLDSTLAQLLKKTMKELEDGCPTDVKGSMSSIWATILILSLLKKELSSQQEEWELIAMKAESWLGKQTLPGEVSKANLLTAAENLL